MRTEATISGDRTAVMPAPKPGAGLAMPLWRVRAVIPCFNRPADLQKLLGDLAAQDPENRAGLACLVVDNASVPALEGSVQIPPILDVEFLRLERNTGGSGGFNAGLGYWLERGIPGDACELLWLIDSDARLEPGALGALLQAMERRPDLAAVGSALLDPETGRVFEVGGRVDFESGEYVQEVGKELPPVVEVGYAAACSLLVRRGVVERAGLMADVFLNGDDVEWCYRLSRLSGMKVGIATTSRAIHPQPNRMRTGARFYAARNAFRAIDEAGRARGSGADDKVVARARFRRAIRELGRGLAQAMVGRADLGWLHIRGLADAAAGRDLGPAPAGVAGFEPAGPLEALPEALKDELSRGLRGRVLLRPGVLPDPSAIMRTLNGLCLEPLVLAGEEAGPVRSGLRALRRIALGPEFGLAVVSARAKASDWAVARVVVTVADGGFAVRRLRRAQLARTLIAMGGSGTRSALRMRRRQLAPGAGALRPGPRPTVSVVLLSYNRWDKLRLTLAHVRADPVLRSAQVIVVDNGSTDGTPDRLRGEFPEVEVLALKENAGVAAFNEAVKHAAGETVLILDDDAWPDRGALEAALEVLARRADVGAVALHPKHPEGAVSEWLFAARVQDSDGRWPVMGCGNLVRREAWERVGGYEESFFLYRNDTDLALKLLAAGYGVYFDPKLVVWHDSPAAARKSLRWFELATRNWVWMCRRHGRGLTLAVGVGMGWAWAHRLAGASLRSHARIICGVAAGLMGRCPPRPDACASPELRRLIRLRLGR